MSSLAAAVFGTAGGEHPGDREFPGRAWGRATTHLGAAAPIMRA